MTVTIANANTVTKREIAAVSTGVIMVDDFNGVTADGVTDDGKAIYDGLLSLAAGSVVRFTPGKTYVTSFHWGLRDDMVVIMHGATLKKIDQRKQLLSGSVTHTDTVIPVANTSGFQVGQIVALQNAAQTSTSGLKRIVSIATNASITLNQVVGTDVESTTNMSLGTSDYISIIPAFFSRFGADYIGAITHNNVRLIGGTLDGNRANYDSFYRWEFSHDIHLGESGVSDRVSITDMFIKNSHVEGITLGGDFSVIDRVNFQDIGGNGIHLSDGKYIQIGSITGNNANVYDISDALYATTTVNGALSATATTIPLTSSAGAPESGYLVINSERISYTGISGNSAVGCTRGIWGTTATTHLNLDTVSIYGTAGHQEGLITFSSGAENVVINKVTCENALSAVGNLNLLSPRPSIGDINAVDCYTGPVQMASTALDATIGKIKHTITAAFSGLVPVMKIQGDGMQFSDLQLEDTRLWIASNGSTILGAIVDLGANTADDCILFGQDKNTVRNAICTGGANGVRIAGGATGNTIQAKCIDNFTNGITSAAVVDDETGTNIVYVDIVVNSGYTTSTDYRGIDIAGTEHLIGGSVDIVNAVTNTRRAIDVRVNADESILENMRIIRATNVLQLCRINNQENVLCRNMTFPTGTVSTSAFTLVGPPTVFVPVDNYALGNATPVTGS